MPTQTLSVSPPSNDHFLEPDGRAVSQSWLAFMQSLGSQNGAVQQLVSGAQTTAGNAVTTANTTQARVTALLASPPVWGVGDYRPSAKTTLDPSLWLECDGSSVAHATYPDLYALIGSITGPGAGPGTFKLPSMPPVFDAASPGPGGPPVLRWFIRVL